MSHPVIFFDPHFVVNVIAGWAATVVGALLLLVAGVWWALAQDSRQQSPRTLAWRGLCGLGWVVFLAGLAWQIVGYVRIGTFRW